MNLLTDILVDVDTSELVYCGLTEGGVGEQELFRLRIRPECVQAMINEHGVIIPMCKALEVDCDS